MKHYRSIILLMLVLALVQLACAMPVVGSQSATPVVFQTPTMELPTLGPTATSGPLVITATPDSSSPTATSAPTNTPASTTGGSSGSNNTACTYRVTFVADVTIPDDTVFNPGAVFNKTWRVRNDGTCTWGPGAKLHALAFTGGSKLNGPDQVSLPGEVKPGQTLDISVNLTAPTSPGTYTSEWKFRVDGDPNYTNTYVGLGTSSSQPLFTRIKVGTVSSSPTKTSTPVVTATPTTAPVSSTRLTFASGGTAAQVSGTLKANESKSYVLSALRGQTLMTSLSSANDVRISLASKDGTALTVYDTTDGKAANAWLPVTGDYIVTVKAGSQDASFTLTATVPARISFASGASSAKVEGKVTGKLPVTYFLKAGKDQTMTATLTSSGSAVILNIYGLQDGATLVSAGSNLTTWTGKLPANQDYVIVAIPSVDSTTFTLDVTVK